MLLDLDSNRKAKVDVPVTMQQAQEDAIHLSNLSHAEDEHYNSYPHSALPQDSEMFGDHNDGGEVGRDYDVGEERALLANPNQDEYGLEDEHTGKLTQTIHELLDTTKEELRGNGKRLFITRILFETLPTLFATFVGMVLTGELLQHVATWPALEKIDELFILIPILINLKGNLEMNLSARLSTAANTGELDEDASRREILHGNLTLLQVQALSVSTLAAVISFALGTVLPPPVRATASAATNISRSHGRNRPHRVSGFKDFMGILAIGMSSAALSGFLIGSFMCVLVLLCRRWRLNPDNIAPPIASTLGDLITLSILVVVSSGLTSSKNLTSNSAFVVFVCLVWFILTLYWTIKNPSTKELLKQGWTPLLGAMVISSGAGIVLERFVNRWDGFGSLSIIISGLPGSIGSVFVSRLSTTLHTNLTRLPLATQIEQEALSEHPKPLNSTGDRPVLTSLTLFVVSIPILASFLAFIYLTGWSDLPALFVLFFCFSFSVVVFVSLAVAHFLTTLLWRRGLDPDTYCLPIHSSLVDVVGQLMLVACYEVVGALGGHVNTSVS